MKIFGLLAAARVFAQELEPCAEGEVDVGGFCIDDATLAAEMAEIVADLEGDDDDAASKLGRRFQIGGPDSSSNTAEDNMRTKRRTQRISLLMAKVQSKGQRIRPREFMRRINSYGCHCWTKPNTEDIGYKGVPLDGIDRSCRALKSCHMCINLDYNNCNPVTTKYRAKLVRSDEGIDIQCTNTLNKKGTNNGDCKRSLCECDKQFAENVSGAWLEWDEKNHDLETQGLQEAACVVPGGSRSLQSGPPNQCCGSTYPDMKPFFDGSHKCVNGHVTPINQL